MQIAGRGAFATDADGEIGALRPGWFQPCPAPSVPCRKPSPRAASRPRGKARCAFPRTLIDEGRFANVHELARGIGKDQAYVARMLRLTLLAPEIVHAALTGTLPEGIGVENLRQSQPVLWSEQKNLIGME